MIAKKNFYKIEICFVFAAVADCAGKTAHKPHTHSAPIGEKKKQKNCQETDVRQQFRISHDRTNVEWNTSGRPEW